MRFRLVFTSIGCLVGLASLAAQANPMRPGRWEVSASMQMGTMSMPPMTNSQCITAEDLKKAENDMPAGFGQGPQGNCKVSDYKVSGSTVTWKMQCTGPQTTSGEGRMVFDGDTYDGTMTMQMPQGTMTVKATGKRTGDCTK